MARAVRLGLLVGLVVAGIYYAARLPLLTPVVTLRLPGGIRLLRLALTPLRQGALVIALLACMFAEGLAQGAPRLRGRGLAHTLPYWVLPVILTVAALILAERVRTPVERLRLAIDTAILLVAVPLLQLGTVEPGQRRFGYSRALLNAVVYGLACAAFLAISARYRLPLHRVPQLVLLSLLLTLELLRGLGLSVRWLWGSALLVALMMAELSWMLSLLALPAPLSGYLLFLAFFGVTGSLQLRFWKRLDWRFLLDVGAVAALVVFIVR
jgi:hypothetical protein